MLKIAVFTLKCLNQKAAKAVGAGVWDESPHQTLMLTPPSVKQLLMRLFGGKLLLSPLQLREED